MIKLFDSQETEFTSNGKGNLSDPVSCIVVEERNGSFEVELEYPIDGIHYSDIELRDFIYCKPNPFEDEQPFRIYQISKPINGIVTINAAHMSYDLSGILMPPFKANGITDVFQHFIDIPVTKHKFTFSTDKSSEAATNSFSTSVPNSIRGLLGGSEGSILDIFDGGEYIFNKYKVELKENRGTDRGVTIRYGKNLTDLKQEENCANVYTGIYPFWYNDTDGLVELDDKIVKVSDKTFDYEKIKPVDFSGEFDEKPTKEALKTKAESYISRNKIGVPKISLDVSFIQLEQSEEYETLRLLETVYLCDRVTVIFDELGVSSTAKCIKTEYDAITDKYISLELGDAVSNLATSLNDMNKNISDATEKMKSVPTKSFMEELIEEQTKLITGNKGGYVVLHDTDHDDKPDEILIMDDEDINKALKIWRWNKEGLGYSSKGYNGPYTEFAVTKDGKLHANYVAAEDIQTGTIRAYIEMISPYIRSTSEDSKGNPTFYLDGLSGLIHGSKIEGSTFRNGTTDAASTVLLNSSGLRVGLLNNDKGQLVVGSDGWIRGKSKSGSGAAVELEGWCRDDKDPSYGQSNGMLYGSRYMRATLGGSLLAAYAYDIVAMKAINSDIRVKKNIEDMDEESSLEFIKDVHTVEFDYKEDPYNKRRFGVIAQEMKPVMDEHGYDSEDYWLVRKAMNNLYRVEYEEFIPHLINCIKVQQKQIDELQAQIQNGGK